MTNRQVPDVVFKTRVRDESVPGENPFRWQDVRSNEIFSGKRIVLLALPGAFTPVCSSHHLPEYEAKYDEFKALGIDEVICLSVNDAFVLFQWGKHLGIEKVHLLPDGNADFTRGMGMLVKKQNLGFGERSWRYSMYCENGEIVQLFEEPGRSDNAEDDPYEVSDPGTMLSFLKQR